jgi:hypothetical protein
LGGRVPSKKTGVDELGGARRGLETTGMDERRRRGGRAWWREEGIELGRRGGGRRERRKWGKMRGGLGGGARGHRYSVLRDGLSLGEV